MALSNMLREPRREITETVVGIIVVGAALSAFAWLDYQFANWMSNRREDFAPLLIVGAFILVGGVIVTFVLAFVTHAIGDAICTALENRGVQMRPRQRYGRRL
jgi:uncharacterized membrane protein YidH (DUF202 family)